MAAPAIQVTDWLALKGRIDTLVMTPAMVMIEPGDITPAPGQPDPFILVSDATNEPQRVGVSSDFTIRTGTLMLSIQWPIAEPISHEQLKQMAGTIAAHFPLDLRMKSGASCLRVIQPADALAPYVEGAYRVATVRVLWSSL